MDNGKSGLFSSMDANILAMIVFLCCTVFTFFGGFKWAFSIILLALTVVLFFIDSNMFVRKCCVQAALIYAVGLALSLVFYLLALVCWAFSFNFFVLVVFRIVNIVLHMILTVLAMFSCIWAFKGRFYRIPFAEKYIDELCIKLGVF